jgi:assimilatory nitrate reductase catalytic subunit
VISTPRFRQGVFGFEGKGLDQPVPVDGALSHVVPDGTVAQAVYFRGGNSADELHMAAPPGVTGTVVVDFGLVEV